MDVLLSSLCYFAELYYELFSFMVFDEDVCAEMDELSIVELNTKLLTTEYTWPQVLTYG